ncbi:MAG: dipeptidase [Planctomycetes bacterium]|nr:dipeptidase [Planctomycetota bacterium]
MQPPAAIPAIDCHADTFYELVQRGEDFFSATCTLAGSFRNLRSAGVRLLTASVWTPKNLSGPAATSHAMKIIGRIHEVSAKSDGRLSLVTNAASFERTIADSEGVGVAICLEGASPLAGDLDLLEAFHRLGLRMVTITWNHSNELASGCFAPEDNGLTEVGRTFIRRMEELGIIVDVAHVSKRTLADILKIVTKPVICSHTGVRRFIDLARNLSDDDIRSIANTGGVMGVDFYWGHLCEEKNYKDGAGIETVTRTIAHIAEIAGVERVAIGSDFDGFEDTLPGLRTFADLPNLADALLDVGFTSDELDLIFFGNAARLYRELLKA